jgi:FkbM family methyltransferase
VIRERIFSVAWPLLWPVRFCAERSPFRLPKSIAERIVVASLPTAPSAFTAELPGGHRVKVQYRETLGIMILLHGSFEDAEMRWLAARALPRTTAIDVGANIGIHTIPLANAVGPTGHVIALEPVEENVRRLVVNVELNDLKNVTVISEAAAADDKGAVLQVSDDPAFHSTTGVAEGHKVEQTAQVSTTSLDSVWERAGRPAVSVIKIDVEGSESAVIEGAAELLDTCRPGLLVEITDERELRQIEKQLHKYGYRRTQPAAFARWNYVFVANGE